MYTVATCAAYVVVLAGGHALAAEGVPDVVKFVVGVFALLQPVNHLDHL